MFAFWDKDINTLVVATHGIVKKTQKTPKSEITKAEGIRKLYFENKKQKDMKKVGDMKLYSFEELLEEDYGKVGTPERDAFERSVDEAVQAYRVGEAIKQAREAQNLTQAQLGEKMGVQRAQVCRLESGKSITLASMMRAFRALGVQVALEMNGIGKVAL